MAQTEDNKVSDIRYTRGEPCPSQLYVHRSPALVPGKLSPLLQPTPVEVFCDSTPGIGGMRGTEDVERLVALDGGAHQFVGAVMVREQIALVYGGGSSNLDEAVW